MDNSFRDSLPVEVSHFIDENMILQEDRASRSSSEAVEFITN
jgi:hypothetical protein